MMVSGARSNAAAAAGSAAAGAAATPKLGPEDEKDIKAKAEHIARDIAAKHDPKAAIAKLGPGKPRAVPTPAVGDKEIAAMEAEVASKPASRCFLDNFFSTFVSI